MQAYVAIQDIRSKENSAPTGDLPPHRIGRACRVAKRMAQATGREITRAIGGNK